MSEDSRGLRVRGRFNLGNKKAETVYEQMLAGDLRTLSVGFIVKDHTYDGAVRVTSAELLEVSVVPIPSSPRAQVFAVRSVSTITVTPSDPELARYKAAIDALSAPARKPTDPERIDAFVA